jgi:thymidylate synthase
VSENRAAFPIATMCRLLGVSFVLEGYDPHPHIRAKVAV